MYGNYPYIQKIGNLLIYITYERNHQLSEAKITHAIKVNTILNQKEPSGFFKREMSFRIYELVIFCDHNFIFQKFGRRCWHGALPCAYPPTAYRAIVVGTPTHKAQASIPTMAPY
jgi:hypothetical protein